MANAAAGVDGSANIARSGATKVTMDKNAWRSAGAMIHVQSAPTALNANQSVAARMAALAIPRLASVTARTVGRDRCVPTGVHSGTGVSIARNCATAITAHPVTISMDLASVNLDSPETGV
ncbi:unnamed protein product [Acanthoscelides obtectus]|uniref:Uncharacterized protein n=1 Tax=Acanthoscelides obtectus TaxID=200917 RepID=A0A9P0LJP1_ACAOB|nr:unnamed protein product [Acanthoscelides obtectus]CAK1655742.1 hypothetical protein AOBTE_LOCUS19293 [Acanthoscelides obtectus]